MLSKSTKYDWNNTCGAQEKIKQGLLVWNKSNLLTIPDFRFHLKDGWNLTKNDQVLVGLKKLSSFQTVLVGKIDWNLTKKFEVACFFGSKLLEIVEVFSSFWWIVLLFRVTSGFKISKVVSSSRIRSSFNWYRFSNFSTVLSCCEQRSRQNGRPHD